MKNLIVEIVGESGSGKSSVAEEISKEYGLEYVQSFTTRKPRYENEKGHIFTTRKQYECNIANRQIGTDEEYKGNMYWANKSQLANNCVYVVTPKAAVKLKENMKDSKIIVIYLKASRQNRYIRMMARDKDNNKALERIEHDKEAFKDAEAVADYVIDANKPLRKVIEDIKEILNSEI